MNRARVYVTQNPMRRGEDGELVHTFDLTPARQYGEIVVLLPSGPALVNTGHTTRMLQEKMSGFTDKDFLLCLGDPVAIAAASAVVSEINDGVVPLLVWDRRTRAYNPVTVDVHNRLASTV